MDTPSVWVRVLWLSVVALWAPIAAGQGSVRNTTIRPFVTALIPVVSGGVVGGISIDSAGVVSRSDVETLGTLREARERALERVDSDLMSRSPMRKISLRGLIAEIQRRRKLGQPVSDPMQFMAGLQRVDLVLAYPERQDIVLAGFAEGWKVDEQGNVVGVSTGYPVILLDDLIVALRTAKNALSEEGISCSIDPTREGTRQLQQLLNTRGLPMNDATLARLENAVGVQRITITGVPLDSHFALVLVAADVLLKRLGMNFEPAPVPGLPSYLELLQTAPGSAPRNAMPRFWLAPNYEPLLRDREGLAWQLRGDGVQALAEDASLAKASGSPASGRPRRNSPASHWAELMTERYEALSAALPVFRDLRNCMDLAVVAALFAKEDLPARSGCDLSLLLDPKQVQVAAIRVPKQMESRASAVPKGRDWIVSVSGGVAVDSWPVLNDPEVHEGLAETRRRATATGAVDDRWWWD
jgi:hypothetical protein